jgi:hypothetical protein
MYRERDFEFVSISVDKMEKRDKALEFLRRNEASNRNFIFSGETVYPLIEAIDPDWKGALPYTIVLEPGGETVLRHQGEIDPVALRKFIVEHPLIGRYY